MKTSFAAAAAALAVMAVAPEAPAFCRTTTCDPSDPSQGCQRNSQSCLTTGVPLAWGRNCLKVGINAAGSATHGISFDQLKDATASAFRAWAEANCIGGKPSLSVEIAGPIGCDVSEYNEDAGNINLVTFRDDVWPYQGAVDVLGRTTVRFNTETGELLDADIEINGRLGPVSADGSPGIDLQSVLTHEAGHLLGLDHSVFVGSTMVAGYSAQDIALRTLTSDDEQGICALYPPGAPVSSSCEPVGGFSDLCGGYIEPAPVTVPPDDGGCAITHRAPSAPLLAIFAGLTIACMAARRRTGRSTEAS